MSIAPEGFVPAHDPTTGEDLMVPAHFIGEGSPFPHLEPIEDTKTPDAKKTPGNHKATGTAGADNPKE